MRLRFSQVSLNAGTVPSSLEVGFYNHYQFGSNSLWVLFLMTCLGKTFFPPYFQRIALLSEEFLPGNTLALLSIQHLEVIPPAPALSGIC